jgi:chorismate mutase
VIPKSATDRPSEWKVPLRNRFFVAGPCSVESEDQILTTALQLATHEVTVIRGGVWKPRTRPGSFEGVGTKGLQWLKNAGKAVGLPVTTEAARPSHVEECLKVGIDILWIGARTTTDPFAVQDIADALRGVNIPVMIKNPMNPDLELWIGAIERIDKAGTTKIVAVHRGFSTYRKNLYRNEPLWRIPIDLRRRIPHLPLICDPSHICGNRRYIMAVSQEAMDLFFDGLMIEVHCAPSTALSDAKQQLTPAQYGRTIGNLQYATTNGVPRVSPVVRSSKNQSGL